MLYTNLKHLETAADYDKVIRQHKNVIICCGRMGPMCIPVYNSMEELENKHKDIQFFDMEFDNPESQVIRNLPQVKDFRGIPFTIYFKDGEVVTATSSIQSKEQIAEILRSQFGKPMKQTKN